MEQNPQLGLFDKEVALKQVADNSGGFMQEAVAGIECLPSGLYTGEDIRLHLTRQCIIPHHHNAWGALISTALKRNLLRDTGKVEHM